jgi:hypothetical protein
MDRWRNYVFPNRLNTEYGFQRPGSAHHMSRH